MIIIDIRQPERPQSGTLWYDPVNKALMVFNNGKWNEVSARGSSSGRGSLETVDTDTLLEVLGENVGFVMYDSESGRKAALSANSFLASLSGLVMPLFEGLNSRINKIVDEDEHKGSMWSYYPTYPLSPIMPDCLVELDGTLTQDIELRPADSGETVMIGDQGMQVPSRHSHHYVCKFTTGDTVPNIQFSNMSFIQKCEIEPNSSYLLTIDYRYARLEKLVN